MKPERDCGGQYGSHCGNFNMLTCDCGRACERQEGSGEVEKCDGIEDCDLLDQLHSGRQVNVDGSRGRPS